MSYLLDTNAVIAVLKNQPAAVRRRLRRAAAKGVAVAIFVRVVRAYGVARSERRRENAERPARFPLGLHRCRSLR